MNQTPLFRKKMQEKRNKIKKWREFAHDNIFQTENRKFYTNYFSICPKKFNTELFHLFFVTFICVRLSSQFAANWHRCTPNVCVNQYGGKWTVRPLLQVVLSRIAYSIANREPIDTHILRHSKEHSKGGEKKRPTEQNSILFIYTEKS